jgi:putative ATPase
MLAGGEDPVFIARRLVILASEDIGNANPEALLVAVAAMEAVNKVGMPEAAINLAQAVIYLSMSPKSNAVYRAIKKAMKDLESGVDLPVPVYLKSGFKGRGYKYPHDYPRHWVEQDYLVEKRKYYESCGIGFERQLEEWLKWMKKEEE